MVNFTEMVKWNTPELLKENRPYGLGFPILQNALVKEQGLVALPDSLCGGKAIYKYDFGRSGTITTLRFGSTGAARFRVKTADTEESLESIQYPGTIVDVFSGTIIDPVKYSVNPSIYIVAQNNGIAITGTQSESGVFTNPANMSLNNTLSGAYSVRTSMRFLAGDQILNSGGLSFLSLNDGLNDIQVQKYVSQIRTRIVDRAGNTLGRDVNNNDTILGEPVDMYVNNAFIGDTLQLTDGVFGSIVDRISEPTVIDEFSGLKTITELTNFSGRTSLPDDYVRVLGLRADYSLTGILADLQRGLFYRPKRINGYYTLRTLVVGSKADLIGNTVTSCNLESGQYVYAEKNDVWTITLLVPAGVHYYQFIVDGEVKLDPTKPAVELAIGECSFLATASTQFVEFVYSGSAEQVFITGTFNNFTQSAMSVGFDPSEILKINFDNQVYYNKHPDWHKLEVEFDHAIPIVGIRFLTDVPFENKQRVRILLDDNPITQDEWQLSCAPESAMLPGVSPCATYSNMLESDFQEACKSYYINNTDVMTASEDGWVEWHFTNDPINDREIRKCKKFALLTRLENGAIYHRAHRGLELILPDTDVTRTTDYIVSDNEMSFRTTRQTEVGIDSTWNIPQVVLGTGVNIITPVRMNDEDIIGEPVSVNQTAVRSFIEQIDQSGISLNNVEIACTRDATLTHPIVNVVEVMDFGGEVSGGESPDDRFTRESFTRANDTLRVVVISIDIEPVRVYYLRLVGLPAIFRLELYETEEDARNGADRIGYANSVGYGFQILPTFINERPIVTPAGLIDVEVNNMIVCFDQNAANTIFRNRPRANI